MIAAGIDLGGTKIEVQIFDADWQVSARNRVATPKGYDALVSTMVDQIDWAQSQTNAALPIGIGAAGLINPVNGHALTANLPATGKPFPADIAAAAKRPITYVNDCRALALSEAIFGVGRGHRTVLSLILGTGVGGGVCIDGRLMTGPTQTGGEFGHTSASAHLVAEHGLDVTACGCGRMGCIETFIAGPGMTRIAQTIAGAALTPPQVAKARNTDPMARAVWDIWCAFTADHLRNLTLTVDPDIIVIGGGLSQMPGVAEGLHTALQDAQFAGFGIPQIALAQGGDSSGARGAAYAALQEAQDG